MLRWAVTAPACQMPVRISGLQRQRKKQKDRHRSVRQGGNMSSATHKIAGLGSISACALLSDCSGAPSESELRSAFETSMQADAKAPDRAQGEGTSQKCPAESSFCARSGARKTVKGLTNATSKWKRRAIEQPWKNRGHCALQKAATAGRWRGAVIAARPAPARQSSRPKPRQQTSGT